MHLRKLLAVLRNPAQRSAREWNQGIVEEISRGLFWEQGYPKSRCTCSALGAALL